MCLVVTSRPAIPSAVFEALKDIGAMGLGWLLRQDRSLVVTLPIPVLSTRS